MSPPPVQPAHEVGPVPLRRAVPLPHRLQALESLIPPDVKRLADIGYDHGQLISRLIHHRAQLHAIGVEIQSGMDLRFWERATPALLEHRPRITLRHGAGLAPLVPGEVQLAVLAGFGQSRMLEVLSESPEQASLLERVVFGPINAGLELRRGLAELGWGVDDECLAYDRRRYYFCFSAKPSRAGREQLELQNRLGRILLTRAEPMLLPALLDLRRRHARALHQPARQGAGLMELARALPELLEQAAGLHR